jgi:hypothetical protein
MRQTVSLVMVLGVLAGSTGVLARPKSLKFPLRWNPNEAASMPAFDVTGGVHSLAIAVPVDKREKGEQIGENVEERVAVPVFTGSDVPAFLREHLAAPFKNMGLDVRLEDAGDRVLRTEVHEFWVRESQRYTGSIRIRASVVDGSGRELWAALIDGAADNFGRSLKPDNYTETLSNAVQNLAAKLAGAAGFRQALSRVE